MGSARPRRVGVRRVLTVAIGCALAAGCATSRPEGGKAALFKAQVGDIAGGVAPGPHSVWYVRSQPVAYVKVGVATWRAPRGHGLRGWIARHFGPRGAVAEPTGVAAASLGLPVPSRVQVTDMTSGRMITVRVDDKAPMTDGVIRLSPEAAKGLGVEVGKPLMIRLRYLAPVMAYNDRGALRYAARDAARTAPRHVLAETKPPPPFVPATVKAAPEPAVIRVADVHPPVIAPPLALRPSVAPEPPPSGFRVQAGAFSNLGNARKAVGMLSGAGPAVIEPVRLGAATLYRVIVPGAKDAQAAARLKARVAQAGFADARVLRPL